MLVAIAAAAVLLAAATVAATVLGVGPFARSAPGSVVYVAISRGTNEADAREIEAIDLDAGTRELFDAGGRITAMALSADRRSLYVAIDAGRIELLDATTGTRFAEVDLRGPTVTSLVAGSDGLTLYALTVTNLQSAVVPIDLDARRAGDPILLPPGAGSAVLRGDTMVVALADPRSIQVVFIGARTHTVLDRLLLPRGSLAAPVVLTLSGGRTAIVGFDPSAGGGGAVRVYIVTDAQHWEDLALAAPFGISATRDARPAYAAATMAGTVHVCVPAGLGGRRYLVTPDRRSTLVGTECGPLAGGADILLARRDPAQLLVLDPTTGKVTRTLPLAGVPARLIR